MPYTKTSIKNTIPIIGNRGIVVDNVINTTGNSVDLTEVVSTGSAGINVGGSINGSSYGINITSDVIVPSIYSGSAVSIGGNVNGGKYGINIINNVSSV